MADLGKNFATLPIDQLICAPILAVAQGQAESIWIICLRLRIRRTMPERAAGRSIPLNLH